jgi:hypothetical protein
VFTKRKSGSNLKKKGKKKGARWWEKLGASLPSSTSLEFIQT